MGDGVVRLELQSRRPQRPSNHLDISKARAHRWPSKLDGEPCLPFADAVGHIIGFDFLGTPAVDAGRFVRHQKELEDILLELDQKISNNDGIRFENNKLILSPLRAEELPNSAVNLQELISERLPRIDLTDLFIEVDSWIHFTDYFEHAAGSQPRNKNISTNLYASLLAQACNFGLVKMAELSGLSYS